MRIDIGHINKRVNSTKQTFTRSFSNVQVTLKEPTSVITPTFILKNTNSNGYKFSEKTFLAFEKTYDDIPMKYQKKFLWIMLNVKK